MKCYKWIHVFHFFSSFYSINGKPIICIWNRLINLINGLCQHSLRPAKFASSLCMTIEMTMVLRIFSTMSMKCISNIHWIHFMVKIRPLNRHNSNAKFKRMEKNTWYLNVIGIWLWPNEKKIGFCFKSKIMLSKKWTIYEWINEIVKINLFYALSLEYCNEHDVPHKFWCPIVIGAIVCHSYQYFFLSTQPNSWKAIFIAVCAFITCGVRNGK